MSQPTVRQALQTAQTLGLERLDAQLLLLHALGKPDSDRAWLLAHDDDVLTQADADTFRQLGLRRAAGEPLAYIVGYKEFFGLHLNVDARVLVPRPDTETLVTWSLDFLQDPGMGVQPRVLDLGTGQRCDCHRYCTQPAGGGTSGHGIGGRCQRRCTGRGTGKRQQPARRYPVHPKPLA